VRKYSFSIVTRTQVSAWLRDHTAFGLPWWWKSNPWKISIELSTSGRLNRLGYSTSLAEHNEVLGAKSEDSRRRQFKHSSQMGRRRTTRIIACQCSRGSSNAMHTVHATKTTLLPIFSLSPCLDPRFCNPKICMYCLPQICYCAFTVPNWNPDSTARLPCKHFVFRFQKTAAACRVAVWSARHM
jgi:hypothetical protein